MKNRKKLYVWLEKLMNGEGDTATEAKDMLAQVKTDLKDVDDAEAELRITKKDLEGLQEKYDNLETSDPVDVTKDPKYVAMEKKLDKVTERLDASDKKLADKEASDAKRNKATTISEKIGKGIRESFGGLTGDLLIERKIEKGELSLDDSGKVVLIEDGVEMATGKDEVLERIRTVHKDDIIGTPGPGVEPSKPGKKTATTADVSSKSASSLFNDAFDEMGLPQ